MVLGKLGTLVAGLTIWYNVTGAPPNYESVDKRYSLPQEISAVETTLPYETRNVINSNGTSSLEKIVKTKDIDFSQDFVLETKDYNLIKKDDWLPSRAVGHFNSLIRKLFFWDRNIGLGLDEEKSKAVLSMLENNENLNGITVRINHNEAIYDWYRMMTEDDLTDRNPFLYRATIGTLTTLKDELFAELMRGDYYNPLTKTAVVYSNLESISAHEFGHYKDFQRFDTDWVYSLSRIVPPVMLYQEWQASENALGIMSENDSWQFNRYLMPAFLTYLLSAWSVLFGKGKKRKNKLSLSRILNKKIKMF